jgi:WD40 repeat protein
MVALVAAVDRGVSAWRLPAGQLLLGFDPPPPVAVAGPEGLQAHPESANDVAVRPDGTEAVVALEGRLLRYTIATGHLARQLAAPGGVLRSVAWSPDGGSLLVTAFYDANAHLVRAADGTEIRRFPVEREGAAVAFAPNGRRVAVASDTGTVALFALDADAPAHVLPGRATALAFAGGRLVAGGRDGVLRVWDVDTGLLVAEGPPGPGITRLAASPRGGLVASASNDGAVRLHDVARAAVVEQLAWHRQQLLAVAWARDVLVSGDTAGRVALWDVGDLDRR